MSEGSVPNHPSCREQWAGTHPRFPLGCTGAPLKPRTSYSEWDLQTKAPRASLPEQGHNREAGAERRGWGHHEDRTGQSQLLPPRNGVGEGQPQPAKVIHECKTSCEEPSVLASVITSLTVHSFCKPAHPSSSVMTSGNTPPYVYQSQCGSQ